MHVGGEEALAGRAKLPSGGSRLQKGRRQRTLTALALHFGLSRENASGALWSRTAKNTDLNDWRVIFPLFFSVLDHSGQEGEVVWCRVAACLRIWLKPVRHMRPFRNGSASSVFRFAFLVISLGNPRCFRAFLFPH